MTLTAQDLLNLVPQLLEEGAKAERAEQMAERVAKHGTDRQVNPYMSDAGRCPRQIYWSMTGEPETNPLEISTLMTFAAGVAYQEAIGRKLTKAIGARFGAEATLLKGVSEEQDCELWVDGIRISGRIDYLTFVEWGEVLIEVKATSSWVIKRIRKDPNNQAFSSWKRQLNSYLVQRDKQFGVLYLCERDHTSGKKFGHPFIVDRDDRLAEADFAWLAQQAKRAEAHDDPGIPLGMVKSKYPCSTCRWSGACWKP